MQHEFTKYERARIIGARALQVAMDAPLLLKIDDEELKEMRYDALLIAEKELDEGALPIDIRRPTPLKRKEKLKAARQEDMSDEEIIAKAQELEKEIQEEAKDMGLVNEGDLDEDSIDDDSKED